MKIVLLTKYKNLGYPNDIVEVPDGFARNFLIPNNFAIYATKGAIKNAEENRRQGEKKQEKKRKEVLEVVEKLKNTNIVVKVKTNNEGTLFGNVTESVIKKAIYNAVNYEVDKVVIGRTIKNTGKAHIKVKLYRDIATEIDIEVEKC